MCVSQTREGDDRLISHELPVVVLEPDFVFHAEDFQ